MIENQSDKSEIKDCVTFYFECGCFYSVFLMSDGRLFPGLACCKKHEAPYQQLENILPIELKSIRYD